MTPRHTRRRDGWTSDDEARLVRLSEDGASWDAIADALGRTSEAVRYRASRLRLRESRPRWTDAEDAELVRLRRDGYSWSAVGRALGRSTQGVKKHAWGLGMLTLSGELGDCYGLRGTPLPPPPPPPPEPAEFVLVVEQGGWCTSIARGDRAEIERIYRSMSRTVGGLRIEGVTE